MLLRHNMKLRTVRTALLVPERGTKAAAAAVESCCIGSGGFANRIVPYSRDEGIRDPWRTIVEVLDPDMFAARGLSRARPPRTSPLLRLRPQPEYKLRTK